MRKWLSIYYFSHSPLSEDAQLKKQIPERKEQPAPDFAPAYAENRCTVKVDFA